MPSIAKRLAIRRALKVRTHSATASRRGAKPEHCQPKTQRRQGCEGPPHSAQHRSPWSDQRDQLAWRQAVAGIRPSSAPSCSRNGSRSPSIASRKTERASSFGFTVVLPIDLSVSQASSNAVSNTTSVGGSKELLWKPRIVPPSTLFGRFARSVKPRRKLGRVCDPRWTITRPNDHIFLA
jgi:hypothetical protein